MNTPVIKATPTDARTYRLDHGAWVAYLREQIAPAWRPGEFDPERWLFTGDPDNPATTSTRCTVRACDTVVTSRTLCQQCQRASAHSDLGAHEFLASYQPSVTKQTRTDTRCVVGNDVVWCQRRRLSNRTGLCHAHTTQWKRRGQHSGLSMAQWCARARPLPPREACSIVGCSADATLDMRLCGAHSTAFRRSQRARSEGECETAEQWASGQPPSQLRVNQFSLALVTHTVRFELLYALQQRDAQGQKLDPVAMKSLTNALRGVDSVATTPESAVRELISKNRAVHAYARMLTRVIALRFEEFRGIRHTDKDVWQCLALDLQTPRAGRRPNLTSVDFTPIQQQWLREATKDWVRTVCPEDTGQLKRTVQVCTLASRALSRRPGGGHQQHELTYADMAAVFDDVRKATGTAGKLYETRYRRGLWARLHAVLELGRKTGRLAELPAAFSRHPSQSIGALEVNEEELGKAIPEAVIAQLDAHVHLLGTQRTYGRSWSPAATAMMFRTVYQVLRDTGRRPNEVVSLSLECLERQDGEYALVYDNHKSQRLRRRLPITGATAKAIQHWQDYRAGLDLPASTRAWLFPSWGESCGPGHLSTNRLVRAIRDWVSAIPVLDSDLPGPEGSPAPFDRRLIYPYAFRHSYAQRHADAGVAVEILSELMDHKDLTVTQGYYTVSLKRKREAIKVMRRYVHDHTGTPFSGTGSAASYALKSVAVPFGNCLEPSNVKAGGKQCPIRFQCAGCGFYRPDPSYLPAIEEHIIALKADRETAHAMEVDDFVVRNLTDQTDAFQQVAARMREKLEALPDQERAEVDQASALLRKARAGRDLAGGRTLLPLTVQDGS